MYELERVGERSSRVCWVLIAIRTLIGFLDFPSSHLTSGNPGHHHNVTSKTWASPTTKHHNIHHPICINKILDWLWFITIWESYVNNTFIFHTLSPLFYETIAMTLNLNKCWLLKKDNKRQMRWHKHKPLSLIINFFF